MMMILRSSSETARAGIAHKTESSNMESRSGCYRSFNSSHVFLFYCLVFLRVCSEASDTFFLFEFPDLPPSAKQFWIYFSTYKYNTRDEIRHSFRRQ